MNKTQMFKPPECATTFFNNLRSILVGHFGLQSVSYRVETPCNMPGFFVSPFILSVLKLIFMINYLHCI